MTSTTGGGAIGSGSLPPTTPIVTNKKRKPTWDQYKALDNSGKVNQSPFQGIEVVGTDNPFSRVSAPITQETLDKRDQVMNFLLDVIANGLFEYSGTLGASGRLAKGLAKGTYYTYQYHYGTRTKGRSINNYNQFPSNFGNANKRYDASRGSRNRDYRYGSNRKDVGKTKRG